MWPFSNRGQATIEKQMLPLEKHTMHHYVLVHVALRDLCFHNPYGFFGLMSSPQKSQAILDDLWKMICLHCDKDGTADFTPRDMKISTTCIKDYPAILIEMPTPHFMTEAYMVCIVLKVHLSEIQQLKENPEVLYFTLERTVIGCRDDRTCLCSWEGDKHNNYGEGPEPSPQKFMEALTALI